MFRKSFPSSLPGKNCYFSNFDVVTKELVNLCGPVVVNIVSCTLPSFIPVWSAFEALMLSVSCFAYEP